MSYLDFERALQQELSQDLLATFDKFYDEQVVMIEASGEVCEGKEANRKRQEEWVSAVQEIHGGGIENMTSDEELGTTMTESWVDVTFKDGNRMKVEEVSVKKWEGDRVVRERFYYNVPG